MSPGSRKNIFTPSKKRPALIGGAVVLTLLITLVVIFVFRKQSGNTTFESKPTAHLPATTVNVGTMTIENATEATLRKNKEQKDQVKRLLQQAQTNIKAFRLTTPAQSNAHANYLTVLQIDPDNTAAKKGIESIVSLYVDMVMQALQRYDFEKGKRYLNRAISISAEQAPLLELQQQVLQLERHYLDTIKKQQ